MVFSQRLLVQCVLHIANVCHKPTNLLRLILKVSRCVNAKNKYSFLSLNTIVNVRRCFLEKKIKYASVNFLQLYYIEISSLETIFSMIMFLDVTFFFYISRLTCNVTFADV